MESILTIISGVSEAVRESVLQKAKELGYSKFMQEPAAIPNDPQEDKTVSFNRIPPGLLYILDKHYP